MNSILPFEVFSRALTLQSDSNHWLELLASDNTLDTKGTYEYIRTNQDMVSLILDYTETAYVSWWMQILLSLRVSWKKLVTSKELKEEYSTALKSTRGIQIRTKQSILGLLGSSDRAPIDSLIIGRADWIHQQLMKWVNSEHIITHYTNPSKYLRWRFFKEIWFKDDHFG